MKKTLIIILCLLFTGVVATGCNEDSGASDGDDTGESDSSGDSESEDVDSSEDDDTDDTDSEDVKPVCDELESATYVDDDGNLVISREEYKERVKGFWIGESIANFTGLVTEMDKDCSTVEKCVFYTDEDWGSEDLINNWSDSTRYIDYVFYTGTNPWLADDDTNIEYMYLHLLYSLETSVLTPDEIRDGWMTHIYSETETTPYGDDYYGNPENWLWGANQTALTLMEDGMLPPETSHPDNSQDWMMIDAQLTTEIFGTFAPVRWDVALEMADLPIRTTARKEAAWISEFYVIMHSMASSVDPTLSMEEKVMWLADQARKRLPEDSYAAGMYDYVLAEFEKQPDKWETTRDKIYVRYQENFNDGYDYYETRFKGYDAGINYAASLVSLFYGRGDLPRTVQIGSLSGWDSDNPTATWGGLLGLMMGEAAVHCVFDRTDLSEGYRITNSRRNHPDYTPDGPDSLGEDTFTLMAERTLEIVDRAVTEEMGGTIDEENNTWIIPDGGLNIPAGTELAQ